MSAYAWYPTQEFTERSNITAFCRRHGVDGGYRTLQARSAADPEWFWERAVQDIGIVWHQPPLRVCDDSGGIAFTRWFPGAYTNLVDSCLERRVRQGSGQAPALRWEREDGTHGVLTYGEAAAYSARVAGGLRELGVVSGDRVAGYLPPVPRRSSCSSPARASVPYWCRCSRGSAPRPSPSGSSMPASGSW